ncbi:hypothetical protein J7T55_004359 [Diaporthe amygdali]|uniref:uncharacterized protein n=1 Tax=Phomopsis amygdali TaxID=1214568 RepID=UPI0022FDDD50|nr:uncharacterized protein J7T55_004359 [Diaporthe amygdali]KAJ0109809.1 hypothetical protein J7T55_004359 [Diaporthe amygdali]
MNRFKTKKKGKDDAASARPSLESESSFSLFGRKKKSQEQEEKKEIDLATALPSSDDFRTSLLMSGLSARFSMLREQDDPSTKIGKASDDSVLLPKRHSRLNDFNFGSGGTLGDIAEVESIKAPPFLRTDSTASEDSSSILTRARPTEGNVMFGGRQKIYKIAVGSSSSRNLGDGMSGRALYGDDLAMSAFQKWRLAEKDQDRTHLNGEDNDIHGEEVGDESKQVEDSPFATRAESPLPQGYNKKRETSSTTSSTPSGGRNSTAATSVVSQPTTLHSQQTTAASSATSTPALERHVTRTRRLYEQGLTQDLQEQQHSVLSRVDTLTRRPVGVRTPDLGQNSPSPTMHSFSDRFGERRTILSKGSAPNLRSMSPPTTGSSIGTLDLNTKASNAIDTKTSFLSSPPLSPPISDHSASDQTNLAIQPRDVGKATAMGVFQRPAQPYDDSRYAERQLQLKQGRETPTQRSRKDSSTSFTYSRSQSVASNRQQDADIKASPMSTQKEGSVEGSPRADPVESPILNDLVHQPAFSPQVRVERPADQDHPALRGSAIPTPLSIPEQPNESQSPLSGHTDLLNVRPKQVMLGDSPTLGPTSGLGGLVRQHLRTESDVSSIFGVQENPEPMTATKSPWEDQDWTTSSGQESERSPRVQPTLSSHHEEAPRSSDRSKPGSLSESPHSPDEEDEFANQLANARRRVREKLTSFVETDNTLSMSPQSPPDSARDLPPPSSRSNPLGILRGKGSRGSLIDRGRDATSRPNKMNGTGAVTMPTPPSSVKQDFDEQDRRTPVEIKEQPEEEDGDAELKEEANAHPGLRAFRQARRELQKRKELEAMARHSPRNGQSTNSPAPEKGVHDLARTPSREHQSAKFGQQRKFSEEHSNTGVPQPPPRSQTRTARDRSGSEDSAGQSRSRSRPAQRSRENTISPDNQKLNTTTALRPKLRSPGLPGTDIRRSPHMPPMRSATSGAQSVVPGPFLDRTNSGTNLRALPLRTGNEPLSAGASPRSPRSGPFEQARGVFSPTETTGSAPQTPTYAPPRRPSIAQSSTTTSTLNDSMKRVINKSDISEPTFIMSTSRVPTMSVTDAREARSRSQSRSRSDSNANGGSPPPLPPVNPRRKRESSRTRTIINGLMGRNNPEADDTALSMSTPHLPLARPPVAPFADSSTEDRKSAFSVSDDEKQGPRKLLRKASSEVKLDARASIAPPQVAVGPPAGRAVITSTMRGPSPNMPGGMF